MLTEHLMARGGGGDLVTLRNGICIHDTRLRKGTKYKCCFLIASHIKLRKACGQIRCHYKKQKKRIQVKPNANCGAKRQSFYSGHPSDDTLHLPPDSNCTARFSPNTPLRAGLCVRAVSLWSRRLIKVSSALSQDIS